MTIATIDTPRRATLDIGLAFKEGWSLFVKDIGPLLLGALVAGALTVLSLGILGGPLFAGLYAMVVGRVRDGRPAEVGDVFSCMGRFWAFFVAALVLLVLIGLASLTIVGGFLLAAIWLYVFPLMVDRGLSVSDAMRESKDLVMKNGFWEHVALVVLLALIGAVAGWPLGVLVAPFTVALVTAAYFIAGGRSELAGA